MDLCREDLIYCILQFFSQFISETIDGGRQVNVSFTDFQKAFDYINRHILLAKLLDFNFSLITLLKSYLTCLPSRHFLIDLLTAQSCIFFNVRKKKLTRIGYTIHVYNAYHTLVACQSKSQMEKA